MRKNDLRLMKEGDGPVVRAALRMLIKAPKLEPKVAMKAIDIYQRLKPKTSNG